jgi:hypothetical protein
LYHSSVNNTIMLSFPLTFNQMAKILHFVISAWFKGTNKIFGGPALTT